MKSNSYFILFSMIFILSFAVYLMKFTFQLQRIRLALNGEVHKKRKMKYESLECVIHRSALLARIHGSYSIFIFTPHNSVKCS